MPNEVATKAYVQDYVEKVVKGSNSLMITKNTDIYENKWDSDENQAFYGAKNILKLIERSSFSIGAGLNMTTNPTTGAVIVSGTKTLSTNVSTILTTPITPKVGKYTLSLVSNSNQFGLFIRRLANNEEISGKLASFDNTGSSVTFDIDYDGYDAIDVCISVHGDLGTVINDTAVYPMLQLASIKGNIFVPYTQTNKDLTSSVSTASSNMITEQQRTTTAASNITKNTNDISKISANLNDIMSYMGMYGDDILGLQVDYENYIYTRQQQKVLLLVQTLIGLICMVVEEDVM